MGRNLPQTKQDREHSNETISGGTEEGHEELNYSRYTDRDSNLGPPGFERRTLFTIPLRLLHEF